MDEIDNLDFSSEHFRSILERISNGNQVDALDELAILFMYGSEGALGEMPIGDISKAMVTILANSKNQNLLSLSSQCILNFLRCHSASTRNLLSAGVLPALNDVLNRSTNRDLCETCYAILGEISEYRPADIAQSIGISAFFKRYSIVRVQSQMRIADSIVKITSSDFNPSYYSSITDIATAIGSSEERSCKKLATALANILSQSDPSKVIPSSIPQILNSLQFITDPSILKTILLGLCSISEADSVAAQISKNPQPIQTLIQRIINDKLDPSLTHPIADLILYILPKSNLPSFLFSRPPKKIHKSANFSKELLPSIVLLITALPLKSSSLFTALAVASSVSAPPLSPQLVESIALSANDTTLILPIIAFLSLLSDPSPFIKTGIFFAPTSQIVDESQRIWAESTLSKLRAKLSLTGQNTALPKSVKTSSDFLSICEMSPFSIHLLMDSTCFDSIMPFLSTFNGSLKDDQIELIKHFASSLISYLSFIPIAHSNESIQFTDISELQDNRYGVKIIYKEFSCEYSLSFLGTLLPLESAINHNCFEIPEEELSASIEASPLKSLVSVRSLVVQNDDTKHAILLRLFGGEKAKKFHVNYQGKSFSVFQGFLQSLASCFNSFQEMVRVVPEFQLVDGDISPSKFSINSQLPSSLVKVADVLKCIHTLMPAINLVSDRLSASVLPFMKSPILTHGLFSPSMAFIYYYPFLFNFQTKLLFLHLSAFDMYFAQMSTYLQFYPNSTQKLSGQTVDLHIIRSDLRKEAETFLEKIPGPIRPLVSFEGERGLGSGPTQEFFLLLSREFCKTERKVFYSERNDEFCWATQGLFPHPSAAQRDFFLFGCLLAKAAFSNCLIDVQLNPAFFKMILGQKVGLEEVDKSLQNSLQNTDSLIGLEYVYPSEGIELDNQGKEKTVTKSNVQKFVQDVTECRVGSKIERLREDFLKGFESVISFEPFRVFTAKELVIVFNGERIKEFSLDELSKNVVIEHGYTKDSTQIKELFEIMTKMSSEEDEKFIEFVTGSSTMPYGGLAGLHPPLTIARKDAERGQNCDSMYPSVSTCNHFFKLPPYSSKKVMQERILTAITNGAMDFGLS